MTTTNKLRRCPSCRAGELKPSSYEEVFKPRGKEVRVSLLTSRCSACGATFTTGSQHDENLQRLEQRRGQYGDVLLGEDIVAFRMRYGITQEAAGKIFGKSKIAFSRYENEASYPDESTTRLLRLAMDMPQVLKRLADNAGMRIPLWEVRRADERKVSKLVVKSAAPEERATWDRMNQVYERSGGFPWVNGEVRSQVLSSAPASNDRIISNEAQVA